MARSFTFRENTLIPGTKNRFNLNREQACLVIPANSSLHGPMAETFVEFPGISLLVPCDALDK